MPYFFGGQSGIRTPQEAAHLRAIAEAMAGQQRAPHTIGEGLSAIGDAIASRRYRMRADRMESEGRAAYESKHGDLLKSLFGGGGAAEPVPDAPETPGGIVPPQPDLSQAHPEYLTGSGMPPPPTMENVANTQLPPAEDLNAIVRTVIGEAGNQSPEGQRAVAEVILNLAREKGMTPLQVVMAKGQFEPWQTRASELNAIDPNSPQYQSVLGNITPAFGPDDPTGGADHFYSPGAQAALGRDTPDWAQGQQGRDIGDHRFYRLGYGGEPDASEAQQAGAEQAAGQPGIQQVADSGGIDPQRIIDALSDPWVPEGQKAVLQAILEQRMKEMAPVDYGITTEGGDFYRTNPRTGQVEKVLDNPPEPEKPTSDMQNYEYAKQSGFKGSFDDWVNRPDPLKPTPDIQNYEYAKANGYKGTLNDWIKEKTAKPPAPYSFTTENGDIYTQDPNTGKVTKAIDNPDKPEKPPADVQTYEYAVAHGFKGTFEEWQKLKDPMVTVNTGDVGAGDKELRKALSTKEGERWEALQQAGTVSGSMAQDFQVLDRLMTVAPQSPLTGPFLQMFPGLSTTGAAFQSIVTRIAPSLRTPGSGATSDLEYEGMLNSLPRLQNYPEANQLIAEVMKGKAALNVERSDVITAYQNDEITSKEARSKLAELNKRSILSPKMKSLLDAQGAKDPSEMSDEELLKALE